MSTRPAGAAVRQRVARLGIAAAAFTLGLTALPGLSPMAQAAVVTPGDIQIQEVYGGGGNSGAAFQSDFVELVNTSDEDLDIDGWTLQYSSAGGTFNGGQNTLTLEGTVPAGEVFLIQLAAGNGNGEPLPAADFSGGINASGSQGVFALSDAEGTLQCTGATCAEDPAVIDVVGWGEAATFSGEAPAPGTSNSTSIERIAASGENASDFEAGEPTPGQLPDRVMARTRATARIPATERTRGTAKSPSTPLRSRSPRSRAPAPPARSSARPSPPRAWSPRCTPPAG